MDLSAKEWPAEDGRHPFLEGGGELARLIAAFEWSQTSLGPISEWPASLKTTVALILRSPVPIVTLWNPDGVMIYNNAYSGFAGARHPKLLGSKVREGWPEVADFNDNVMKVGLAGGTLSYRNQELTLHRNGGAEQVWMNLDYSPVLDETGKPAGVIAIVVETTATVRAERWLQDERERLRQMFEQAPGFMAMLRGPDHVFDQVNPAYRQLVGHRDVLNMSLRNALPEIATQGFLSLLDQVYASGQAYSGTGLPVNLQRTPGGDVERRYVDLVYQPVKDPEGRVIGIFIEGADVTNRVQAEASLRQSEARLRRAQEAGGVGIFAIRLSDDIVFCTPEFCRIYGLEQSETVHASVIEDIVHPEDSALVSTPQSRADETALLEVEYRIWRPDPGEWRWIARKAEYERDENGAPVRMVGVVQDVTERRAAQRAIEESATQLRAFAQALPNHVWISAANGRLEWLNDRVYDYTGAQRGTLEDNGWPSVVHPADRDMAAERWQAAVESQSVYETEFRIRKADGEYRWHLVRALPIIDGEGALTRWIGTNTDIHERKLTEAENTRDRIRIWTSTNDLMGTCGADGRLKTVNPAWSRLLGYEADELLARSFFDFIDPDDRDKVVEVVSRLAAGQAVHDLETRLIHKEGGHSLIAWSAEPDGDVFYVVGRDVTEQRATEEALRQAQKMEAVGQLTGGIAHDFNNLLQGITGSLDLIQKRVAQGRLSELDRFVNGAMTSANRAAALTHRLLAFSRRQPLDPRPVRINPLIASMEDLLRRTLGEAIELELVQAGGLWLTKCDPNQLESAVLNLAINARDAMPDGGKLTIETCNAHLDNADAARQRDVRPGQYVCISVTDTGTGMTPEIISRAFEPFFTTKPIGQGTGLGLSMIYGFARQSDGFAKIYSEVGAGATLKLYLPRHRGKVEGDEVLPAADKGRAADEGETVLVVEDEPVVRGLIAELLNDLGYQALEAPDGPTGLEILRSGRRIDLLVTDVGLPGLNGRQVADGARELRPDLKVLFMTGYAENATEAAGFLEPGMAMITKPFAMESLATRIRDILEDR